MSVEARYNRAVIRSYRALEGQSIDEKSAGPGHYLAIARHDEELDGPVVRLIALRPAPQLPAVRVRHASVGSHVPNTAQTLKHPGQERG